MFNIRIDESGDYQECYSKLKRILNSLYPGMKVMDMKEFLAAENAEFDIWVDIQETEDAEGWKYAIEFNAFPKNEDLGNYPDIKLSELFYQTYQWNCLISTHYFFKNMDYYNPYWEVALVDGKWYLADSAGTKLMGPYSDGEREYAGDRELKLIAPLDLSNPQENMFDLNELINKKAS